MAVVLSSCHSGITRALKAPETALTVSAVLVYPVRLTGTPALRWRELELGQRLVQAGLARAGGRLAIYGPTEFTVSRWDDPRWAASTAAPLVLGEGRRLDEVLAVRTSAERRVTSNVTERQDAQGRARGGAVSEEVTWLCTLELLRPSTGEVLGTFTAQVTSDPFAPTGEEEFDPDPALTRLLERMVAEALRWTLEALPDQAPDVALPRLTLALGPAATISQREPDAAPMDALSTEVWVHNRARFLSPSLPEAHVPTVARLAQGMLVLEAPPGAGVQAGDVIVRVHGAPALPQVLARRRLRDAPVPVVVRRGRRELDALCP
jgi:hypothetical protein